MSRYRLAQQPIMVTVDQERVQETLEFVERMREDKVAHNVTDRMFDITNTSEGINVLGHLGEQAVAQILGINTDTTIRTHGDDGWDLEYHNIQLQVKTSNTPKLIFNAPHLFSAEAGILAQFVGEDKRTAELDPSFVVWGWITHKEFMQRHYVKNFGYGDRWVVDSGYLHALDSILEEVNA